MRYGLFDGNVTGSEDGQPVAPLMGQFQDYDGGAGDYQMGPHVHAELSRSLRALSLLPRSLTETDAELVWFVRGDAKLGGLRC